MFCKSFKLAFGLLFFVYFVPFFSSCHEKATLALYFGRIRTRLGIVHFRVFRLFLYFLPLNLMLVRSRDNHRKAPYARTQQRVNMGGS